MEILDEKAYEYECLAGTGLITPTVTERSRNGNYCIIVNERIFFFKHDEIGGKLWNIILEEVSAEYNRTH